MQFAAERTTQKLVLSVFSASVLSNMIDNVVANGHAVSSRDHYAGSVKDYFANKGEGENAGGCSNQRNMQEEAGSSWSHLFSMFVILIQ